MAYRRSGGVCPTYSADEMCSRASLPPRSERLLGRGYRAIRKSTMIVPTATRTMTQMGSTAASIPPAAREAAESDETDECDDDSQNHTPHQRDDDPDDDNDAAERQTCDASLARHQTSPSLSA